MVSWNPNIPFGDTTSYVDKTYFDSKNGYSSCYTVTDYQHKDKWMVDSGCTDHLSLFLDDFVSKEDCKRNCKTANGTMPIYGPGTVLFKHNNGEHDITLVLDRVYYAPHILHHLLSITALTKKGFRCTIGDKTQIWDKTATLIITATQLNSSDSLHWFSSSLMQPDSNTSSIQRVITFCGTDEWAIAHATPYVTLSIMFLVYRNLISLPIYDLVMDALLARPLNNHSHPLPPGG